MSTTQAAISATSVSSQVLPANTARRFLYIRNYATSGQTIWVAFGQAATAGTNGELEIPMGIDIQFGGYTPIGPGQMISTCPTESINVITATGTAIGCVITT